MTDRVPWRLFACGEPDGHGPSLRAFRSVRILFFALYTQSGAAKSGIARIL